VIYSTVKIAVKVHSLADEDPHVLVAHFRHTFEHHGQSTEEDQDQQADIKAPASRGIRPEDDMSERFPEREGLRRRGRCHDPVTATPENREWQDGLCLRPGI
jgi:hypothetical protein